MSNQPRDIVLAAVAGYDWEALRPFIHSLRGSGFGGEVRFFVSDVTDETVAHLDAAGVEVSRTLRIRLKVGSRVFQPYTPKFTRLRWRGQPHIRSLVAGLSHLARDRRRAVAKLAGALSNLEVARYFWYWSYLKRTAALYRNVMLSDVRDVLFVGQPFEFDIRGDACFFLEDERWRLASQKHNRLWLHGAYGQEALDALGDRPIICSGVTIGSAPAILEYLTVMVDHLARLPRQYGGIDQGVHNYLLHNGLIPRARIIGNGDGPVLTLGLLTADEAHALVRERLGQTKVIHQYDRHPQLIDALAELLAQ